MDNMQQRTRIAPSILSADFARLGEEVKAVSEAGADYIHIDVMDGHFVPNITIGADVVKALRPHSKLVFDVHLMISPADMYLKAFADAGADIITIHAEAGVHLHRSLQNIKALGKKAGVAICPATPVEAIANVLDMVDLVLIMSVNPGFGGQAFIDSQLDKISQVRKMIDCEIKRRVSNGNNKTYIDLEVDGGIGSGNARKVVEAGADVLVAGSAVFAGRSGNYLADVENYKKNIANILNV